MCGDLYCYYVFFIFRNLHEGKVREDPWKIVEAHLKVSERGTLVCTLDEMKDS